MSKKVVIGIVAKHYPQDEDKGKSIISDRLKQAIFDNGAIAIGILSPNNQILYCADDWLKYEEIIEKNKIIQQLELCDGIILQGGTTSEAYESWICKYAYDNDIPIMGFCAGQNNIVRALGGTTKKIANPEDHWKPGGDYVHNIKINKSSKLYSIIKKENIMVNSIHKKAVNATPSLKKVAFCNDGYTDGVEAENKKFYMGLRFHPEYLYKKDENMNNIFKEFIKICAKGVD